MNTHMHAEWTLREEIYRASHNWPAVLLFLLIGALLFGAAALVWPSPYEASLGLQVGLNTYRALEDRNVVEHANNTAFNHPDDYKNWQMVNLSVLVYSPEVIADTQNSLRSQDPYWQTIEPGELSQMLKTYWRNAGRWRLAATHTDPSRAAEAVVAWREAVLAGVAQALDASQRTLLLDIQIQEAAEQHSALLSQQAGLEATAIALMDLNEPVRQENPVPDGLRQELLSIGGTISVPEDFPAEGSPPEAYASWISLAQQVLVAEKNRLQVEQDALLAELGRLEEEYATAARESLGVSAALVVESIAPGETPALKQLQPTGLMLLLGAALGLLIYGGLHLLQPMWRRPDAR